MAFSNSQSSLTNVLKESSPPLLLVPSSDDFVLGHSPGSGLLLPVSQSSEILQDGDVDNFVGQNISPGETSYFGNTQLNVGSNFCQANNSHASLQNSLDSMKINSNTTIPGPPSFVANPPLSNETFGNKYRMIGGLKHIQAYPSQNPALQFSHDSSIIPAAPIFTPSVEVPINPPSNVVSSHDSGAVQVASAPNIPDCSASYMHSSCTPATAASVTSSLTRPPKDSEVPASFQRSGFLSSGESNFQYCPVVHHWCYLSTTNPKYWHPFSHLDNSRLESAFNCGMQVGGVVTVEGGRYDVNIAERTRHAIYWDEAVSEVRRCSWFFKPEADIHYEPYDEEMATTLEEEYKSAVLLNLWHKKKTFSNGDTIIMHNPQVIVQFSASAPPDEWGTTQSDARPKVVHRGIADFQAIQKDEPDRIDHVVYIVHGIGSTCDLRFRSVIECINDFRNVSHMIQNSHFKPYIEEGKVGRVEFLPVQWHAALHSDATGIDKRLNSITLSSISKLRHFTNDTLLDILFYASPTYCQEIVDIVGKEINRLYYLFLSRNPTFSGQMSVAGHSLGSLILFDMLSHQKVQGIVDIPREEPSHQLSTPIKTLESMNVDNSEPVEIDASSMNELAERLGICDVLETFEREQIDLATLALCDDSDLKEMGIPMGPRKKIIGYLKRKSERDEKKYRDIDLKIQKVPETDASVIKNCDAQNRTLKRVSSTSIKYVVSECGTGIPYVQYPQLAFSPQNFFALGSPIAMFLTVRGVQSLGPDFQLPTCSKFFNIFHPFDPVAYRIEPLVYTGFMSKPVLMPHHKGRKRLHLELKENLGRMTADLKAKFMEYMEKSWKSLSEFAQFHRMSPEEFDKQASNALSDVGNDEDDNVSVASSVAEEDVLPAKLNQGRRIDYVLQEKPIESFNDYIFALGSHGCYWESEDTVLHFLKEVYADLGVSPVKPGDLSSSPVAHMPPAAMQPNHPIANPLLKPGTERCSWDAKSAHPSNRTFMGPPPTSGFVQGPKI